MTRIISVLTMLWRPVERLAETLEGAGRMAAVRVHTVTAPTRRESGQTVAEYALVLLVAAAIATAFLLWARQSGRLDAFFDAIFDRLVNSVDSDA